MAEVSQLPQNNVNTVKTPHGLVPPTRPNSTNGLLDVWNKQKEMRTESDADRLFVSLLNGRAHVNDSGKIIEALTHVYEKDGSKELATIQQYKDGQANHATFFGILANDITKDLIPELNNTNSPSSQREILQQLTQASFIKEYGEKIADSLKTDSLEQSLRDILKPNSPTG